MLEKQKQKQKQFDSETFSSDTTLFRLLNDFMKLLEDKNCDFSSSRHQQLFN
jgi:hypothetical protein